MNKIVIKKKKTENIVEYCKRVCRRRCGVPTISVHGMAQSGSFFRVMKKNITIQTSIRVWNKSRKHFNLFWILFSVRKNQFGRINALVAKVPYAYEVGRMRMKSSTVQQV